MAKVLDGKALAASIKKRLLISQFKRGKDSHAILPKLVSIRFGDDAPSKIYVDSQERLCKEFNIEYIPLKLAADATVEDFKKVFSKSNSDTGVTAIIVQHPLPRHIEALKIHEHISPDKDAEGMHPQNIGRLFSGSCELAPCTSAAVMEILKFWDIKLRGKEVIVVGHSEVVGKPLSIMLLNEFATVTICHIATSERKLLEDHIRRAEVLISAVGAEGFKIPGEWIKEGAAVIDVATKGDVDFDAAKERASFITPVPGGVGPVTNILLIQNVLELYKWQGTKKYTTGLSL